MIYRTAILSVTLLTSVIRANAAAPDAYVFKGTCRSGTLTSHPLNYGTLSESDGVNVRANAMNGADFAALMKRVRATHLTLGSDGFLWSTRPVSCDSALVWVKANSKAETAVSFSNGDPAKSLIGFSGVPIDGDGPIFFPDSIYLGDGKPALQLNPNGDGQSCHFYFTDHGGFTPGWENRLTVIECNARVKLADGHLISADVRFDATQTPGAATANKALSPSSKVTDNAPNLP